MSEKINPESAIKNLSRRNFIAGSAGLATLTTSASGNSAEQKTGTPESPPVPVAPFDTFRDYIAAIEAAGLVKRFKRLDQDQYELTAVMYRLIDEYGWYEAPAVLAEEIKINGQWYKGPVITNHQGHLDTEAIVFGLEPIAGDSRATYRKAMAHLEGMLEGGEYPQIDPVEIARSEALCKQVVLRGDEIDLTRFAFIKSNPADGGRYINTGAVFTSDPEMGDNFGTYRCQLRGPRTIGINPEPNQTGWKMLMAAKERGEKVAKVSIALGQDPIVWMISGSRVANRLSGKPISELAIAGGLRGKALEVIRSETNDHLVPAHCEMIIEGDVPLDQPMLSEGPFGEMYGYLGLKKDENFWMTVTAVTHRRDPWVLNQFTGVTRGYVTAPTAVLFNTGLKRLVPQLIEIHSPVEATGLTFVRIDKTAAGQGIEAGTKLAKIIPIYKVVIVVDKDVDVLDANQVYHAMGARWQPYTASNILEKARGMPLDPSSPDRPMSSKIVIDATKQWPEEGGPEFYPELNRTLLEQGVPGIFEHIDVKFGKEIQRSWP
jgi:4-hydroxy-3-polyprenylbenzoate decarboxylase